uniref:Thioredoxin domain-containing protein n=1 Tax=Scylla olivacea TaxID=85551 RepID=A0A0P4WAH5_SCYOL
MQVLEELENIDDDTDRIGVGFVKTQDLKVAERYGVTSVPALLYFEHQVPTVYEGDLLAEEDVLQWLILQKTEDTIETVNRNMLEVMLEDTQYLAVFFYKPNCRACETVLAELENIDDECDLYGIHMVKIQDAQLAKRYGIKTLPALIYFRNGNPLIFDGDMQNEGNVLEWLKDDDNRDLDGEIEAVNTRMLKRLLDESPFMAVFFYEDDCTECEQVLHELENIDEEVDMYGIDFVKINDPDAAHRFNILHTPALVYFRKKVPLVYDGDLLDEEKVFQWLTSQDVFEIKDEIEEVNRKMLEKLLDENDFVAVYFYEDNAKCQEVLSELEKIDDETDDLDITFVKIRDTRYAKKYGIQKLPALVYFRRRFPSIYRGDLMVEEEVLEWLQKNRFKHPELNLFMYATGAITLAFIMYTLFLIFCFRSPGHQKAA